MNQVTWDMNQVDLTQKVFVERNGRLACFSLDC